MAYVVLALGVLMAAVGGYAIVTGYPIIQVERGWAAVISGSVLLTGGLVTVALWLVIRTLADIRAALRAQPGVVPATPPISAPIGSPVLPQSEPPDPLPMHEVVPALGSAAAAAAVLKATEPPAHEARDPLHEEPPPREHVSGPVDAPPFPKVEPGPEHHADGARIDEPTRDGYELQSPSTPEHDLVRAEPTPSPSEEDWLDRALSDFETGLSSTHPAEVLAPEHVSNAAEDAAAIQAEVPPIHPEPAVAARADETLIEPAPAQPGHTEAAHDEPAHSEPASEERPDTEPEKSVAGSQAPTMQEPAPHDLAVIGRYESDGTSYVMYADGSIEAQSDAGVYRFRSMAELKAFIEG